jgi:hypothetical protein
MRSFVVFDSIRMYSCAGSEAAPKRKRGAKGKVWVSIVEGMLPGCSRRDSRIISVRFSERSSGIRASRRAFWAQLAQVSVHFRAFLRDWRK